MRSEVGGVVRAARRVRHQLAVSGLIEVVPSTGVEQTPKEDILACFPEQGACNEGGMWNINIGTSLPWLFSFTDPNAGLNRPEIRRQKR